ncbi:MAG: hypothetical protein ACREB2_11855 [Pseudolabrys sp.]
MTGRRSTIKSADKILVMVQACPAMLPILMRAAIDFTAVYPAVRGRDWHQKRPDSRLLPPADDGTIAYIIRLTTYLDCSTPLNNATETPNGAQRNVARFARRQPRAPF